MILLQVMLPDGGIGDLMGSQGKPGWMGLRENLIIAGAFAFAIGISFLWALRYSKKNKLKGRHKRHRHRRPGGSPESSSRSGRRRRSSTLPPSTTLAQTGGLPPKRDQGTPPPPMP